MRKYERREAKKTTVDSGVVIIGFDWKIIFANDFAWKNLLISKDTLKGNNVFEVFQEMMNPELLEALNTCMQDRVSQVIRCNGKKLDSEKICLFKIQPVEEGVLFISESIESETYAHLSERARRDEIHEFLTVLDKSKELIQKVNNQGQILLTNQTWRDTLGYTEEELQTLNIFHVIAEESLESCQKHFQELMEGKSIDHLDIILKAKNGKKIYLQGSSSPLFEGGEIVGALGYFKDTTEFVQIKFELDSEIKFNHDVLQSFPYGIIAVFDDGKIDITNKQAENIFGYNENELIDKNIYSLISPELIERHDLRIENFLELDKGLLDDILKDGLPCVRKNGESFPAEISVSKVIKQDKELTVFSFRDISEKIQMQSELFAQKEFTENILNNLPADIAVLNPEQKYIYLNHSAVKDDEIRKWLIGKDDFEYCKFRNLDTKIAERRKGFFDKAIENKNEAEFLDSIHVGTPNEKHILRKYYPVFKGEKIEYFIGYGIDVSQVLSAEKSFKTIFNSSKDLIQTIDMDGNLIICNNEWHKVSGYSEDEIKNLNFFDTISTEHQNIFKEIFKDINTDETPFYDIGANFITKEGKVLNFIGNIIPIKQRDKLLINIFFKDITLELDRENIIQSQKTFYETLLDNIPVEIAVLDEQRRFVYLNKQCIKTKELRDWLHLKKQEDYVAKTGKGSEQLIRRIKNENHTLKTGETTNWIEQFNPGKPNEVHVARSLALYDDLNGLKRLFTVGLNISSIIKAEKELAQSAELNRKIIESSDHLFYIKKIENSVTLKKSFLFITDKVLDILGIPKKDLFNNPDLWYESIHPEDMNSYRESTEKMLIEKSSISRVYRFKHKTSNEYEWFYDFVTPVLDENGNITEIYGSLKNISELKQREEKIKNQNHAMEEMLFITSHKVRQPVAHILGISNLFESQKHSATEVENSVKYMRQSALALDDFIKELTMFIHQAKDSGMN